MNKKNFVIINYNTDNNEFEIHLNAPVSVCWQVNNICNLNCKYCISNSGADGTEGLETKKAKKIIKQISKANVSQLNFAGGEPLLRNDIEILIDYSKKKGLRTTITTNGTILNEKILKALKKADLVEVSIDGDRETHNSFRGKEVYDITIENIKKIIDYGCNVRINTYLCNSNKHCIEHLQYLDCQLNVKNHLYLLFKAQGRGQEHKEEVIDNKELKNVFDKIYANGYNIDKIEYDKFLHSNVNIDPNGNVFSQGFNDTEIVGNILKQNLSEIYNNPIFNHKLHLAYHIGLK